MNKVKLILSVIVVSAIFLAGIYSKVEDLLFADKMDQMEVQIKGDVSSLILAYQAENKFLRQWVQLVNENTAKNINWNSILPYFAIAQLNTNLQVVEWSFRDKSPVSSMSKENLTQLINSFHIKTTDKNIHHFVYSDAEKKKIFLTLVPQGQRLWVFVSQGENLQSIMDGLKASSYMLALINDDFLSLANVKSEYIGQRIFENQILSQIKNGSKTSASGSFKINSGEEFFAFYQRVPNSDMY
ncbi:MAG: hypothetical protein KDD45_13735, partial [Bdellovibrionales bacterium]|nr:hypothetical protein [Bdellovibrionales bacterium]